MFVSKYPEKKIQNLARYLNKENLTKSFYKLKKGKAVGIDGITIEEYEANLEENINNLYKRLVNMTYKPKPSKRIYIPKPGSNKKRPLGIPCLEDKMVQYVLANVLNQIYEPMFI